MSVNWKVQGLKLGNNLFITAPTGIHVNATISLTIIIPPAPHSIVNYMISSNSPSRVVSQCFVRPSTTCPRRSRIGPPKPDAQAWVRNGGTIKRQTSDLMHV